MAKISCALITIHKGAEQMRQILLGHCLKYNVLEKDPGTLLKSIRHISRSSNASLCVRCNVQYNLYAGSIVALGTQEQRELLYSTQKTGALGCFAFTEVGAGVMSGAGVETLAKYNAEAKLFQISSPTPTSRKNWISQV